MRDLLVPVGHRAQTEHLLSGARSQRDAIGRARSRTVQWTVCAWRGAGPLSPGAACKAKTWLAASPTDDPQPCPPGRSCPALRPEEPARVSIFISRTMIWSSRPASSSPVEERAASKMGSPSVRRYNPSSARQCRWMLKLAAESNR
jgi:hypothetical protein